MIAAFSPFLALRYLLTRRINLLGVFGVMFAVWAIVLVDSVFTGFVGQIRDDVRSSATDLMLTDLPHDTSYLALRTALVTDEDVVATAPRLRHHGMLQPLRRGRQDNRYQTSSQVDFDHTVNGFATMLGIEPAEEEAVSGLRQWLVRGPEELTRLYTSDFWPSPVFDERAPERKARMLLPNDAEWTARRRAGMPTEADSSRHRSDWPGVVLGWQRVRRMRWFEPAEAFDLLCASFQGGEVNATLHTHSTRVAFAGCFATGHRTFDETMVLMPITTLRSMLGQDAKDPSSIDIVTDVAVRVRAGLSSAQLANCKRRLQALAQAVLRPGSAPCLVADWEEQNQVFLSAVAHEQGMMQFVLFVVMLVAAFVIYATLHMMVVQKVRDIGILAAIGGSPRGIGAVFLLGGLTVAVVGTLLGVGTGVLSALALNDVNDWLHAQTGLELFPRRLFDLREVPCRLAPSWIATVAIGAVVLALVVAFIPSRKAARMHPVEALSHE